MSPMCRKFRKDFCRKNDLPILALAVVSGVLLTLAEVKVFQWMAELSLTSSGTRSLEENFWYSEDDDARARCDQHRTTPFDIDYTAPLAKFCYVIAVLVCVVLVGTGRKKDGRGKKKAEDSYQPTNGTNASVHDEENKGSRPGSPASRAATSPRQRGAASKTNSPAIAPATSLVIIANDSTATQDSTRASSRGSAVESAATSSYTEGARPSENAGINPKSKKPRLYHLDYGRILAVACVVTEHCGSKEYSRRNTGFVLHWVLPFLYGISGYCFMLSRAGLVGYLGRLSVLFCAGVGLNWLADVWNGNYNETWKNTIFQMAFVLMLMAMAVLLYPLKKQLTFATTDGENGNSVDDRKRESGAFADGDPRTPPLKAAGTLSKAKVDIVAGRAKGPSNCVYNPLDGIAAIQVSCASPGSPLPLFPLSATNKAKPLGARFALTPPALGRKSGARLLAEESSSSELADETKVVVQPASPGPLTKQESLPANSAFLYRPPPRRKAANTAYAQLHDENDVDDATASTSTVTTTTSSTAAEIPAAIEPSSSQSSSSSSVTKSTSASTSSPINLFREPPPVPRDKVAGHRPSAPSKLWTTFQDESAIQKAALLFYSACAFAFLLAYLADDSADPNTTHYHLVDDMVSSSKFMGTEFFLLCALCSFACYCETTHYAASGTAIIASVWLPRVFLPYTNVGFAHLLQIFVIGMWTAKVPLPNLQYLRDTVFRAYWPLVLVFLVWLAMPTSYGRCDLFPRTYLLDRARFYLSELIILLWFLSGGMVCSDPLNLVPLLNYWSLIAYTTHEALQRVTVAPFASLFLHFLMPGMFLMRRLFLLWRTK
ncbi:unnamed protein product [Amoebophrya sp. A120]|nr:unnamed protein product [Amoebophrya sp. A120]|eukprot:GSA120T00005423001.1